MLNTDYQEESTYAYAPDTEYPVSLALWHWKTNGTPTPISGDRKSSPRKTVVMMGELHK